MIVGERLAELRKDRGLLQKDLAKILGVSRKSISHYEREIRSPSDDVKKKLAKYFEVSMDYLMGLTRIEFYDEAYCVMLPKDITLKEKDKIEEYIEFVLSKSHRLDR